jgi:hypothetical protein
MAKSAQVVDSWGGGGTVGQTLPVLTVSMELGIGHHFTSYTVLEIPK